MQTNGFLNLRQLNRHFASHGAEIGASSAAEYQAWADVFLGGAKVQPIEECVRGKGDIVRFNPITDEYGVLDSGRTIRTYFKPIPCASLRGQIKIIMQQSGRCHGHPSNLLYFQSECKKW
jgi:filamentous hemagglutinin